MLTGGGHAGETPDGVEALGNVSLDELVSLYRRASALVFPSLYEGFGLPPLEAMACGCPVACSDAASLPEVCGDAARYFSPDDAEEMAAAVAEVLDDPAPWVERGLARAAEFTWERAAAAARGRLSRAARRSLTACAGSAEFSVATLSIPRSSRG